MSPDHDAKRPGRGAVDAGIPADQWRRIHPISPVLNAWKVLAALLAFATYQNADVLVDIISSPWLQEHDRTLLFLGVADAFLLLIAVIMVYTWLSWRATTWAVGDSAVWFRQGIVFRTQRHARLDRVQAVDIIHPFFGRIFGLGQLKVEVAGGAESSLTFGYLPTAELDAARAEILARAAGLRAGSPGPFANGAPGVDFAPGLDMTTSGVPSVAPGVPSPAPGAPTSGAHLPNLGAPAPAPEAPERLLYTVSVGRLVGSMMLSTSLLVLLTLTVALLAATPVLVVRFGVVGLSSLWGLLPLVGGLLSVAWGRFAGEFGFTAAVSPDGIRVRRGLTSTRSQTIPPRRIHAVHIHQPLLWRAKDWYRVTITQAGYGKSSDRDSTMGGSSVLLPVGDRNQAELALWLVVRDLGVADPRAFLDAAFHGSRGDGHFLPIPDRAWWIDPLMWRRRAVAVTNALVAIRNRWPGRGVTFLPVERIQSAEISDGPVQRGLGVATIALHTVPGEVPTTIAHIDAATAPGLLGHIMGLSRVRRAAEPPERWMERIGALASLTGVAPVAPGLAAATHGPVAPVAPGPAPAVPPVQGATEMGNQ